MIKILIKKEGYSFRSIEIKGHANSAPHGEDLICAAVSAIVTGCANNINDLKAIEVKLDEGHATFECKKDITLHDDIVLETMVTALETVAEGNDKFIKIQIL